MVQLQIFPISDNYLQKKTFALNFNNNSLFTKLFHSYDSAKNVISKFSGRLLIGQNDSLDLLL